MTHKDDMRRAAMVLAMVQRGSTAIEIVRAIRASDAEAGMVLVPRLITEKMLDAWEDARGDLSLTGDEYERSCAQSDWSAMITAHEKEADDA